MSEVVGPKYVKRANMWTVTTKSTGDKGKVKQDQSWFSSELDARKFVHNEERGGE